MVGLKLENIEKINDKHFARYLYEYNKILYTKNSLALPHEFLHAISTYYNKKKILFYQALIKFQKRGVSVNISMKLIRQH